MKYFLIIFTFFVAFCSAQSTKTVNPNPPYVRKDFKYDKVVLYVWKSSKDPTITNNGKLINHIDGEKTLSKPEIDSLHQLLKHCAKTEAEATKEQKQDFWLHQFGVVYYLKNEMVADFTINSGELFYFYWRVLSEPTNWPHTVFLIDKKTHAKIDAWFKETGLKNAN